MESVGAGGYGSHGGKGTLWVLWTKFTFCGTVAIESSHVCSQSRGVLCGPQERGACLVQTLVPGAEEDQDTVEFAKS